MEGVLVVLTRRTPGTAVVGCPCASSRCVCVITRCRRIVTLPDRCVFLHPIITRMPHDSEKLCPDRAWLSRRRCRFTPDCFSSTQCLLWAWRFAVHDRPWHVCDGQDAKHHHAKLVFNAVPGVRRGEMQILHSGIEAIRCVLLNGIHHASRNG